MDCQKYQELEDRLKLRNKLLKLGIGSFCVGPTGPKGDKGDKGEIGPAGQALPSISEGVDVDRIYGRRYIWDYDTSKSMAYT